MSVPPRFRVEVWDGRRSVGIGWGETMAEAVARAAWEVADAGMSCACEAAEVSCRECEDRRERDREAEAAAREAK